MTPSRNIAIIAACSFSVRSLAAAVVATCCYLWAVRRHSAAASAP
ncbi:hypothetical protein [Aeoliella mucimassa]|nr:hypothetical protein [Aeoliella mucimassa]